MMISTDFEARKAIIDKLGGNSATLTSIFQCELVILALYGGDPHNASNIFEADKLILSQLGGDPTKVNTVFEARKAIITRLGGSTIGISNNYEASLAHFELAGGEIPEITYYSVVFKNWNGTILYTTNVIEGHTPIYNGTVPTRPSDGQYNYTFNGWTPSLGPVYGNIEYTASYTATEIPVEPVYYTVIFKNWDGTILQTSSVEEGQTPVYTGSTPTRPSDGQYDYTFDTWTPSIAPAAANATYTASYTATAIPVEPQVANYVTFTAEETGSTIGLYKLGSSQTLEYSTDAQSWTPMTTSTTITLANINDKAYVRGILNDNQSNSDYTKFKMTGKIAASGNCNAIWNYEDLDAPLKNYCGFYMFNGCISLTTAPELPATTLADYCYQNMFQGCDSLTHAPELPATTTTTNCYSYMFAYCDSLTQAPELPATTLTNFCYQNMFNGCTSLTQAPELPATTLILSCYQNMFNGCTSLTQAPELPATTLKYMCYSGMFQNCTNLSAIKCLATDISAMSALSGWTNGVASSGVFCKAPGVTWPAGTSGIPTNWTTCEIEDTNTLALAFQTDGTIKIAKVSSSTDFQPNISMSVNSTSDWQTFGSERSFGTTYNFTAGTVLYFKGNNPNGLNKTNADYIQFATTGTIAAFGSIMSLIDDGAGTTTTIPNERCFAELFRNTTITRAPKLPATTLTRYCYLNMFRSCTSLTVAPNLPAETLAPNCYQSMFNGCTQLVSVNLPATTLASACYNQTFVGCTSLTSVSLPAETLVDSCYNGMFQNCSALNRIICNATDISASNAVNNWTDGVASTGTFRKAAGVSWPTGTSGIPEGWTVLEL